MDLHGYPLSGGSDECLVYTQIPVCESGILKKSGPEHCFFQGSTKIAENLI
jgi:hypothetical protein